MTMEVATERFQMRIENGPVGANGVSVRGAGAGRPDELSSGRRLIRFLR